MMKSNHLALLLTVLVFASPIGSLAQQAAQDVPLLTLDDAVSIALVEQPAREELGRWKRKSMTSK